MRKSLISILLLSFFCSYTMAQKDRPMIRKGNDLFEEEKYMEAEIAYRKALENKQDSYEGQYNLAGALYKQKKYKEAAEQYQALAGITKDEGKLSEIYHNMGNAFLDAKDLEKSIAAYKESLKTLPEGGETDQTRYNLAYAMKMLKEQQQQEQQQKENQDKEQDKDKEKQEDKKQEDQNKDQQDKEKEQDKKDKGQDKKDQQQDQKNKDQEQQNKEKEQQQISKQNAEQILNALKQDEQEVRKKIEAQKAKAAQRKRVEKDW